MAEWKYRIERIEFKPEMDPDDQLDRILREFGQEGWELVQILQVPANPTCRLIFKTERSLTDVFARPSRAHTGAISTDPPLP